MHGYSTYSRHKRCVDANRAVLHFKRKRCVQNWRKCLSIADGESDLLPTVPFLMPC